MENAFRAVLTGMGTIEQIGHCRHQAILTQADDHIDLLTSSQHLTCLGIRTDHHTFGNGIAVLRIQEIDIQLHIQTLQICLHLCLGFTNHISHLLVRGLGAFADDNINGSAFFHQFTGFRELLDDLARGVLIIVFFSTLFHPIIRIFRDKIQGNTHQIGDLHFSAFGSFSLPGDPKVQRQQNRHHNGNRAKDHRCGSDPATADLPLHIAPLGTTGFFLFRHFLL